MSTIGPTSALQAILSAANSSMGVSQATAALVSQNLANAQTPGYATEILPIYARYGGLAVGSGDPIAARSALLEHGLAVATGRQGLYDAQIDPLTLGEQATNDLDGGGLTAQIDGLRDALMAATSNPLGTSERAQVLSSAQALVSGFQETRGSLQDAADGARDQAKATADQVNHLSSQIAALNGRIRGARGDARNALVTTRTAALRQLTGLVGVDVLNRPDGTVQLSLAGGQTLVEGDRAATIAVNQDAGSSSLQVSLTRADGSTVPATTGGASALGGTLGGLVAAHDDTLEPAIAKLDQTAYDFATQANAALEAGYDPTGAPGGPLFSVPATATGAAAAIAIDPSMVGHPEKLAFSGDPTVPGDGTALNHLLDLTGATDDPSASALRTGWRDVGATVSSALAAAKSGSQLESGTVDQISNMLASEEGVSIDDELMRMSEAQTQLQAASTVIQTAQSMTATVLAMMDVTS